jgi:hypothetical protein
LKGKSTEVILKSTHPFDENNWRIWRSHGRG